MYSVTIRDHIMVSHSLKNEAFGPAQNLHGATYIVDLTFLTQNLNDKNIVIDIGLASDILSEVLRPLKYSNLDKIFKNDLTTTEFIANYICKQVRLKVDAFFSGKLAVTLGESHIAWAKYEE